MVDQITYMRKEMDVIVVDDFLDVLELKREGWEVV